VKFVWRWGAAGRKVFFFEKKKQKTFALWRVPQRETPAKTSREKSLFAAFSSEKEDSSLPCLRPRPRLLRRRGGGPRIGRLRHQRLHEGRAA
jgi:hypothetical protein